MYSYQCVSQVSTAPRTACAQMCVVVAWILHRINVLSDWGGRRDRGKGEGLGGGKRVIGGLWELR